MLWTTILGFLGKLPVTTWIIVGLISTNVFTYSMWQHTSHVLKQERTLHTQDVQNFKIAQSLANQLAEATRSRLLTESKANAAKADANYSTLLAQYHASLVRYGTNHGSTVQANHNQLPTPQGSNGPGASTDLPNTLTITGDDAQICAVNTARLQAVHDWAITLPRQEP